MRLPCQTNLEDVKCDYIYLKRTYSAEEGKWIFSDRVPHDPDKTFAPGEFTKRYQKILETVELYFGEGIDWQVFLQSFQKFQEQEKLKVENGDRVLSIVQTIENTGDGSFVIKVGVDPDVDKGEYEKKFFEQYQPMLEAAKEEYRSQLAAKDKELDRYFQQNTQLMKIIEFQANRPININNNLTQQQGEKNVSNQKSGNTYNTENAGIVHNENSPISGNAKVVGVINEAEKKDLAQAAAEIKKLLDQLEKNYPTNTTTEKMTVATKAIEQIETDPSLKQKALSAFEAGLLKAIETHPLGAFVLGAFADWQKEKS